MVVATFHLTAIIVIPLHPIAASERSHRPARSISQSQEAVPNREYEMLTSWRVSSAADHRIEMYEAEHEQSARV
jgi:hypothetical protein